MDNINSNNTIKIKCGQNIKGFSIIDNEIINLCDKLNCNNEIIFTKFQLPSKASNDKYKVKYIEKQNICKNLKN